MIKIKYLNLLVILQHYRMTIKEFIVIIFVSHTSLKTRNFWHKLRSAKARPQSVKTIWGDSNCQRKWGIEYCSQLIKHQFSWTQPIPAAGFLGQILKSYNPRHFGALSHTFKFLFSIFLCYTLPIHNILYFEIVDKMQRYYRFGY